MGRDRSPTIFTVINNNTSMSGNVQFIIQSSEYGWLLPARRPKSTFLKPYIHEIKQKEKYVY